MPKKPTEKVVADAIAALDTVRRTWLRQPGVTAVDVGFKITGDVLTDVVALRVHVARKLPVAELARSEVFNDTAAKVDRKVGGFPVDVIEATYGPSAAPVVLDHDDQDAIAALERTTVYDPLIGGISCGNTRVTAGTIGAIVFDRTTGAPMILSNWHVLAGASAAVAGESIVQPGNIDGGTETVATLTRMRLDSGMDAAVATLKGARGHSRDLLGLGTITGMDTATLGMLVVKSGRTTGITRGVVDGVSLSTAINYGDPGVVSFSNQIRIVPRAPWPAVDYEVSRGGDSGSVWLNEANNRAIGLHFAGETDPAPASENAICSPIAPIATALDFTFQTVLLPWPPKKFHICDRYPWICSGIYDWPRWWKIPLPDPPPFDLPFDVGDLGNLGRRLGGLVGRPQAALTTNGGCNCDGAGHDADADADEAIMLARLAMLVAAHLQQES